MSCIHEIIGNIDDSKTQNIMNELISSIVNWWTSANVVVVATVVMATASGLDTA